MKKLLRLDDCPAVTVFRKAVAILRADPEIAAVVRDDAWSLWDGEDAEAPPEGANRDVLVRVTPAILDDDWSSPDQTTQTLGIVVDFDIQGTCADDPLNFWEAVKRAFYPADDAAATPPAAARVAIESALRDAGAYPAVLKFSPLQVAPDQPSGASYFSCRGVVKVQVNSPINP